MLDQIYRPQIHEIQAVKWTGDPYEYDLELCQLGGDHEIFLVVNPYFEDPKIIHYIDEIPETDKCVVWKYQGDWVAKLFTSNWDIDDGYEELEIVKPKLMWNRNPDIDRIMVFQDNPLGNFEPDPWDRNYKLVWHMDPRFNPLPDKVWVVSCQPMGKEIQGIKDMGYLTPDVTVEFNEHLPDLGVDIDQCCPPFWELINECAYELDPVHRTTEEPLWVVKFTPNYRKPRSWKWLGTISPQFDVEYNPDLPKLDYELDYVIPWHDLAFEHIWMLDRKHLQNGEEDIWAFKIRVSKDIQGSKIVDYISPAIKFEYNPVLPKLDYELDYVIPWHDLAFEHLLLLDRKHLQNGEEDIWAVKFKCLKKAKEVKILGSVSPNIYLEHNPSLPELNYGIDYVVPWYDLKFDNVFMLDKKHWIDSSEKEIWAFKFVSTETPKGSKIIGDVSPVPIINYNKDIEGYNFPNIDHTLQYHDFKYTHMYMLDGRYSRGYDIWAVEFSFAKNPEGLKVIGTLEPIQELELNKSLQNFNIEIDYKIPYHDRNFVHVWYLDPDYSDGKKIWAAKLQANETASGEKVMGNITPVFKNLDVIFISYHEPNAEENWQRLLEKAPYAKRVDGVKGIFEAHKQAARIASSDMFFVVDGDAWITDDFEFDFQPSLFDRDCAYVWYSLNPVNGLTYGYGGVKLFPKRTLLRQKEWTTLDMFTGILPKTKVEQTISCVTTFNVDEFSTWRSAFRECVKLYVSNQIDRLNEWIDSDLSKPFAKYAILGASQAIVFAKKNIDNNDVLRKINDREWLRKKFKASVKE